jgi:excisionase family DNA binding protein
MNTSEEGPRLPEYITAEQLARGWQVSVETVLRGARAGRIPHVRVGRLVRFPRTLLSEPARDDGDDGGAKVVRAGRLVEVRG